MTRSIKRRKLQRRLPAKSMPEHRCENRIMPQLLKDHDNGCGGNVTGTEGWNTKAFRDEHGILKPQKNNGVYWFAKGEAEAFMASECRIVRRNAGLALLKSAVRAKYLKKEGAGIPRQLALH